MQIMKKIFNAILLFGTLGTLLFSCRPMDLDAHKLGAAPTEDQLAFTSAPSAASPNIIELVNTSSVSGVALWDLGNGTTVKGDKVSATYPFKGDYTVTMSLYTSGGSATISKVVTVSSDDYGLLDTPGFNALTGGANADEGRTWVFARYTKGHFGVGDVNAAPEAGGPAWWQCDPNGKDGCSLYENEYTFIQKGTKLIWKNQGSIYTNENGMNHLGIQGTPNAAVGDFDAGRRQRIGKLRPDVVDMVGSRAHGGQNGGVAEGRAMVAEDAAAGNGRKAGQHERVHLSAAEAEGQRERDGQTDGVGPPGGAGGKRQHRRDQKDGEGQQRRRQEALRRVDDEVGRPHLAGKRVQRIGHSQHQQRGDRALDAIQKGGVQLLQRHALQQQRHRHQKDDHRHRLHDHHLAGDQEGGHRDAHQQQRGQDEVQEDPLLDIGLLQLLRAGAPHVRPERAALRRDEAVVYEVAVLDERALGGILAGDIGQAAVRPRRAREIDDHREPRAPVVRCDLPFDGVARLVAAPGIAVLAEPG